MEEEPSRRWVPTYLKPIDANDRKEKIILKKIEKKTGEKSSWRLL